MIYWYQILMLGSNITKKLFGLLSNVDQIIESQFPISISRFKVIAKKKTFRDILLTRLHYVRCKRGIALEQQAGRENTGPLIFYPDSTHQILRSYLSAKCIELTHERTVERPKCNIPDQTFCYSFLFFLYYYVWLCN